MTNILYSLLCIALVGCSCSHVTRNGSEWKQTVSIPTCRVDQNMEVIYPQPFNGTVTIECNDSQVSRPSVWHNAHADFPECEHQRAWVRSANRSTLVHHPHRTVSRPCRYTQPTF